MASTNVTLKRSGFGQTMRYGASWLQPLVVFLCLSAFIVYATWAALQNGHYHFGSYLSPLYSPEIFGESPHSWFGDAQIREVLSRIRDEYERAYYTGIICERRAKAQLHQGSPGSKFAAYEWLREAMEWFEKAETIRPHGNDDAILRWNTCARMIMNNHLSPRPVEEVEQFLE